MTKHNWEKLTKEIDDKPKWNVELYKEKIHDFAFAYWRVIYNDGTVVDGPPVKYPDLQRTNVKSISVVIDNKALHTVQVKDDFFLIRRRNLSREIGVDPEDEVRPFGMIDPKRCIVLATKGNIAWVWDDGDIDELSDWGDQSPYRKPKQLRPEEK